MILSVAEGTSATMPSPFATGLTASSRPAMTSTGHLIFEISAATEAVPVAGHVIEPELPSSAVRTAPLVLEPIVLPPDLELIETHPDRLRIVASKVEPPPPPLPPRVRPPLPPISDEPLIQVDTRK